MYDAKTNPTGVRCSLYDNAVNLFGRFQEVRGCETANGIVFDFDVTLVRAGTGAIDDHIRYFPSLHALEHRA
jgi:hypothetical protein